MNDLQIKNQLPVKSLAEITAVGELFERSGMFGCSQQGQGLVMAMTCVMEGKTPIEVIETYHIIDGRPSMRADAMLANFIRLGGKFKIISRTPELAKAEFEFKEAKYTAEMSFKEAQDEPYIFERDGKTYKKNWRTPRARMQSLWARVISDGVRTVCPLANKGSYTPEEVQDFTGVQIEHTPEPEIVNVKPEPQEVKKPEPKPEKKAEAKKTEQKAAVIPEEDGSIVPVGDLKGKKWSDPAITIELLQKCLAITTIKSLTPAHRKCIEEEILRRTKGNANE